MPDGGRFPSQTAAWPQARAARRNPALVSIHGEPVGAALAAPPGVTCTPGQTPWLVPMTRRGAVQFHAGAGRQFDHGQAAARLRRRSRGSLREIAVQHDARQFALSGAACFGGRIRRGRPAPLEPPRSAPPPREPGRGSSFRQQTVHRRPAQQFQAGSVVPRPPNRYPGPGPAASASTGTSGSSIRKLIIQFTRKRSPTRSKRLFCWVFPLRALRPLCYV